MDLNEIQKAWNSQDENPALVVDQSSLLELVKRKGKSLERLIGWTEIFTIGMLLFNAAMFMRDPILEGHDLILVLPGIASLIAAAFVVSRRITRKRGEIAFNDSLKGIIEKSIARIDYQISRMRTFLWWFATPLAFGLIIGLVIVDPSKRYLFNFVFIPLFILLMGLSHWMNKREIKNKLVPERNSLKALLKKLDDGESDE